MLNDQLCMLRSLELAKKGQGFCSPNPAVGCVITNENQQIIAEGYHHGPGLPHAEIEALKDLHGDTPHTLYVTLEPCCHFGKTPPCTDAIINANIKRVVYGYQDPNSIVKGNGEKILNDHQIPCEYRQTPEIDEFYKSYTHWHHTKKPFVTAKIAMSLNGIISKMSGEPIQITGDVLNRKTHEHRKTTDAILTTYKTILHDNPQLNARIGASTYNKHIYILDSQLKISEHATIFQTAKSITLFHDEKYPSKENIRCRPIKANENGLNLQQVLQNIGEDGIHDLWVEAGGKCFESLMKSNLLNKAYIYIAPKWITDGKPAFQDFHLAQQKIRWEQAGNDVFLEIDW